MAENIASTSEGGNSFTTKKFNFDLSPTEIEDLRANWQVVNDSPIPVAKLIFKHLFERLPDYQKKFPMYDHKTALTNNNAFVPHMRAVVTSLNNIIMRLGDEKTVPKIMDYIATSHHARSIGRKELEEIGISIKSTLKALNKERFTPAAEEALNKFWANFLDDYSERLERLKTDKKK